MLIGQSLIAPGASGGGGTHIVYGPWFPRQGDKFTAVVEVIRTSNISGGPTLQVWYETKNQEDADNEVVGNIGTVTLANITAPVTQKFSCTGCKELVRCVYVLSAEDATEWIHLRANPPVWQVN